MSFWIKEDRLKNEIGKEFTIILRTKGCSWSLGENGGCSMCGYVQDACIEDITDEQIITQFSTAINSKIQEIESDTDNYILKIFNSGSFFDDSEISKDVRQVIYERIAKIEKVKEIIVESRVEFITSQNLEELNKNLKEKHVEVAIGLETVNDRIRNNYINKNLLFEDFKNCLIMCNEHGIGVKAYLLLKPPFLNEESAIEDCSSSIRTCIDLNVSTISINPINIQKGSLVEHLWYRKQYHPPWYYSLFKCLKNAINSEDLKKVRIMSDPSGAGSKRGIHNCLKRDCNENMKNILNKFVLNQDLNELNEKYYDCDCHAQYLYKKNYR